MTPAERAARLAASDLAGGDRAMARAVLHGAELAVTRRLLAQLLPDGEEEYWRMVREEIQK